jgi:hypothetical protein
LLTIAFPSPAGQIVRSLYPVNQARAALTGTAPRRHQVSRWQTGAYVSRSGPAGERKAQSLRDQ